MRTFEQVSWTDTRIDRLKQLAADGLSASRIAADLGGITRNAVIGKLSRMNISLVRKVGRPTRVGRPRRMDGTRARKDTALLHRLRTMPDAEAIPDIPPDTSPDACTLMQLTGESCRWPLGEPSPDMQFCGSRKLPFGSYCARHAALARGKPMNISEEERERRRKQGRSNFHRRD